MREREDAEKIRKAEKEIGENIPEGMKGLDTEDVGEPEVSAPRERRGQPRPQAPRSSEGT